MFAAVSVFNVSTRMCTIKNKMAKGFLPRFLETFTQTREPSSSYLRAAMAQKVPSVSIDGTLVGLQVY